MSFKEAQAAICIILLVSFSLNIIIIDAVKSGAALLCCRMENDYDENDLVDIHIIKVVWRNIIYNKQYFCGFDTCRAADDDDHRDGDCLSP